MRQLGQQLDREDRAGLVVRPHDAGDGGLRAQRTAIGVDVQAAARIHGDVVDLDPAALLQPGAKVEDGRMLHRRGDDLVAAALRLERGKQGSVVGLRAAARPDDLVVVFGAQQRLHLLPRGLQRAAHRGAEAVDGGGVAELLGEEGQHGLHHVGIDPGGRVVVEVNGSHGALLLNDHGRE